MPNRTGDPPKQRARRSLLGTVAATMVAALIAAAVGFVFAYPLAGALACPRCFGFTPIAGHTYVETAMPPADRARTAAVLRQARAVVLTFYGSLDADPAVFVCATPECYQRFGGGNSRGMAMLDHALILSPDGVTPVIAAHAPATHCRKRGGSGWRRPTTGFMPCRHAASANGWRNRIRATVEATLEATWGASACSRSLRASPTAPTSPQPAADFAFVRPEVMTTC
jgi:hypothetical protein